MTSAIRNKKGLIVGAGYTRDEVKRPITSRVTVEKVESIPGSTAGAGSGDFHQYRHLRRHEIGRLELMEKEYKERVEREQFELTKEYRRAKEEDKTAKKALKRQKKKAKKKGSKQSNTQNEASEPTKKIKLDSNLIIQESKPETLPEESPQTYHHSELA